MESLKEQIPSLKEMVYSLTQATQDILKHAAENKTILADESQARNRLDVCLQCEFFIVKPENSIIPARCAKCGCNMKVKTRFAAMSCPIGKWRALS